MKVITKPTQEIIEKERDLLKQGYSMLEKMEADQNEKVLLQDAISLLSDPFLLVVAGEYNSGKSAFINAILGEDILETGITPTTDRIHILDYAETRKESTISKGIQRISLPIEILKETLIVDTPGTNAILREHEVLTKEYIPRSDLVLFITSIDRPFTESERAFLEQIKQWGKKIVFIINKIDLIDNDQDLEKVINFIGDNAFLLLNQHPKIFSVSAKNALLKVRDGGTDSNLDEIQEYIFNTLTQRERLRIKLLGPLSVLEQIIHKYKKVNKSNQENIFSDVQLINDIHAQLSLFQEDAARRFKFRYADIDNAILEFQKRGIEFFDDTFRIGRIFDLANNERIQREYKDKVIKDLSVEMDSKVNELIEWLVDENYKQWQSVNDKITERMAALKSRIVTTSEKNSGHLERQNIIKSVRRESLRVIEKFDRDLEAKQIANDAQISVATSAAIEAGAIGLGTLVTILATTASADLTGILLAGLTATLGFFIIPAKRNQAKTAFNLKINQLRDQLFNSLSSEITHQLDNVADSIKQIIEPYNRFVESERSEIRNLADLIEKIEISIAKIRSEVEKV
jgi:small GTP-binding protein